jgi:DNA polymerase III epsilon subunit-like protein
LASFFKIDVKNAHHAEDDARVCMEIFIQCLSKLRSSALDSSIPNV